MPQILKQSESASVLNNGLKKRFTVGINRMSSYVPCIHQQKDCGKEDIQIWRNVSHVSRLDALKKKRKGKRDTHKKRKKSGR